MCDVEVGKSTCCLGLIRELLELGYAPSDVASSVAAKDTIEKY